MSALRGRVSGWLSFAVLALALAIVSQSSFADTHDLRSASGQNSAAHAATERGVVPAVPRTSVTKADSTAEDRAGLALVAVLVAAVAAFAFPARRGRIGLPLAAPTPRPGSPTGARGPPVAPVV